MRIVGGAYKGRPLAAPKGMGTRPTTDRTRESLFNILLHKEGFSFDEVRVVDLFAGSGALGFEAMSRGGSFCLFVEIAAAARGAIRQNQETLQLMGATRIHRRSATGLGPKPTAMGASFGLAFLDPPYGEGLVDPALASLREGAWLSPNALCVVEQAKADDPPQAEGFVLEDERSFGDSVVRFIRCE